MMSWRSLIVPLAVSVGLASAVGGCGGSNSPASPSPPTAGSTIYYTAVGASDTAGIGSSSPCVPFTDCPSGMGYVPVIARRLTAQNYTVNLSNLGIPGAFIGPDFQSLASQYGLGFPVVSGYELIGNLIDGEAPFVPKNSTVVTIFTGGNDVRTVARALDQGAGGSNPQAFLDQQVANFGNDFNTLLNAIRQRAPSARIIVANLPNFAGLPYTKNYSSSQKLWMQKISVGFSTGVINKLTGQGAIVVDLLCNAQFADASIYSSDGFHPNDTGYALLANAMLDAITSTSAPAPSSSCSQMTLVH